MGAFGLIFKTRVRIGVNASDSFLPFGAVELDASMDETHTSSNEITRFPVEQGVNIADHVRRQPENLVITGMVTDHPLVFGGALRSGRSLEAYQNFLTMMDQADLISVVTSLRQYSNMVLETMVVPRNSKLGSAVQVTLTFSELLTAQVALAAGTSNLGTQNLAPV